MGYSIPNDSNRLSITNPELAIEWSDKNEKGMEFYTKGSRIKVWWRCKDGHEWISSVSHRTSNGPRGCPYCSGKRPSPNRNLRTDHPELIPEWSDKNPPMESFCRGSGKIVWWKCKYLHEWEMSPNSRTTKDSRGCPYCSGRRPSSDNNLQNQHPELISEWSGKNPSMNSFTVSSGKKVWWRCKDGHEWEAKPNDRTKDDPTGCPKCFYQISKPEIEISDFIQSLGFETINNKRHFTSNKTHIDIFIPSLKVGIEYNGLLWHGELKRPNKNYHLQKLENAESAGIRLITIFENEWLTRPQAVKTYLSSILGTNHAKLQARKLTLKKIDSKVAQSFIESHHIQGKGPPGCWNAGLYQGDELVSVLVVGKTAPRNKPGNATEWNLTRYCNSNYQITGGFQRLWAAFLREVNPDRVVTFSDRRWSVGGLYERNGFVKDNVTRPSYWYFKSNERHKTLYHKCLFQRKRIERKLGPILAGETEYDAMKRFGYDRIWDCGLIKWVYQRHNL